MKLVPLFRTVACCIASIFAAVFGSWSPPRWLRAVFHSWRTVALTLCIVALAGYGGLRWWLWREAHQPRPRELVAARKLTATITTPALPSWNKTTSKLGAPSFSVQFATDAALLALLLKDAAPNTATLAPTRAGKWTWSTARTLTFQPEAALPAGTKFTVTLDPSALAAHTMLAARKLEFTTPVLTAKWEKSEFYTDLTDPALHQAVFTVTFNQPISGGVLAEQIKVTAMSGGALYEAGEPEVIQDEKDPNTYHIRTPRIRIPIVEDFARVSLGKELLALCGGAPLGKEFVEKVAVPTRDTGFRFTTARTQIVPNEDGEPRQFIFLESQRLAAPEVVAKNVELWTLPPKEDGTEWAPAEVTPEVLAKCQHVTPEVVAEEDDAPVSKVFSFRLPPLPQGPMFVRVKKGTPAPGGFLLGTDYEQVVTVPMFPREARVVGKGGVLALSGERKVNLKSRGYEHLRTTLARVPAAQVNHLVSQTEGRFEAPEFSGEFGMANIARFHSSVQSIAKKGDHEASYSAFDFAPALARADANDPEPSRGLFYMQVEGVRRRTAEDGEANKDDPDAKWIALSATGKDVSWQDASDNKAADARFILVTDLGLLVKRNADGTRDVFVQSYKGRAPIAGVRLTALATNGEPLAEATTDAEGHAALPALDGLKRERKPVALVARKDSDLAFIPWARSDRAQELSRFEIGGVKMSEATALDAFVFTERGIYRPGDSIHLAAIVRTRDWAGKLAGLPVEAVVINAKQEEAGRFTAKLPADGFLDFTIPTAATAPTGVWRLDLRRVENAKAKKRHNDDDGEEDNIHIGHTLIRVEDFQPDRMKMLAALDPKPIAGWITARQLSAKVELQTLFGIAAADRRVTAKMHVAPGSPHFEPWPKWIFHLPSSNHFESREVELPEQKSDAEGHAAFTLDVSSYAAPLLRVGVELEGFEPDGGRGVSAGLSVFVSPHEHLLGWRADDDLNYIPRDVPRSVRIIAIGPDLKPVAVENLTRLLIETRHISVLTKQDNGSLAYVSRERDKELERTETSLPADESAKPLPVTRAGQFRYEWRDEHGLVLCTIPFTVVGPGEADRNLERDTELELTLPDHEWRAGEQLEVSLRAPYTGAGLITIERERVLAWQWFQADSASSVQHITVPEGIEGGAYVNVAFVRGLDSPEIFTSPLSAGVAHFRVVQDRRKMEVTLDTPERARPGEPLHIGFRTPRPARVAVWAVDEGIHRVTSYRAPEPLSVLLQKRSLEVGTWQLLDLLLPEYSLLKKSRAFGGDGDEPPELTLGLNPFKRRREAPVVFWSGIIEAGPGRKEVIYHVPDYFAGRLNILAAVVAPDAVGVSEKHTIVKGPFVLTQNAPFFAVPGDEFIASLTVANQLEGAAVTDRVTVKAEPTGPLEILDAPREPILIAPNTEQTVRFRVRVKDALGNAELKFSASGGGERVELKSTLSVRPATPFVTAVQSGWFRQPTNDVSVGRELFPQFAKREAVVSPTPFGFARGLEAYLRQYPHGCTEQITSKAFPWLVLKDEADFGLAPADAERVIAETCATLATRQTGDGGFGYWTARDGVEGFDFITIYVAHFLTEARTSGYAVPEPLMAGALRRLKIMAALKVTTRGEADIQAAAIYLLTRSGEVTTNYALNLSDTLQQLAKDEWQRDLSAAWLAATWSLLKKEKEAQALIAQHVAARAKKHLFAATEFFYDSPLSDAAQSLTVLCRHFPKVAGTLGYDDLKPLTEGITEGRFNTLSASWSIMALKSYAGLVKQSGIKLGLEQLIGGKYASIAEPRAALLSAHFAPEAKGVRFLLTRPKDAPDIGAWYQTIETGYGKALPAKPETSGLEVFREFLNEQGRVVTSAKVGETLTLRLRVRNVNAKAQSHLALVDLLPGGFDNAPGALQPGLGALGAEYVDVREDRNLVFTSLGAGASHDFTWRVRPTCAGTFIVPPAFGEAMYDRAIHGSGATGKFTVLPRE